MADDFGTGGSFGPGDNAAVLGPGDLPPPTSSWSMPSFGGGASAAPATSDSGTDALPPNSQPAQGRGTPGGVDFGGGMGVGRGYQADPQQSALDQSASLLQQRINRANQIGSNPLAEFFNPEGAAAARAAVPAMTEQLQTIRGQQAAIQAGRQQAETLGLAPGEAPDSATQEQRVEIAKQRALSGDLKVFKGLQAVDPKAAESIQDQVHEAAAGHLDNAQLAFDSLAGMQNQGQYAAKLRELRSNGVLTDLEGLGLKVPDSFDKFNADKGREGQALREARIGIDTIRQKLEDRNTFQPMEEKEANTYKGRMTTAYGDQITNGTWSRNGASGTRGLVVNGAADPRDLGKSFTFASPDQRKEMRESMEAAIPKQEMEKYRAQNRTYQLATTDEKGNKLPEGQINTNPNVQQGVAEGLASMLRGGSGGANIGLLKIETAKRGFIQGLIDKISTEKGAAINELKAKDVNPYLSTLTQKQIRDVMDVLQQYNEVSIGKRAEGIAERAGALGLKASDLGLGKDEVGGVGDALERGRQAQIDRMTPQHQAIGGGDGVFQLGAQRPGAGATNAPPGTSATTQLPGARPLATPVQQASVPPGSPTPGSGGTPPSPSGPTGGGSPSGAGPGGGPSMPPGASPNYIPAMQRIEAPGPNPWKATTPGSSASGAYQMIDSTWAANKPPGAPARAKDATPAQQQQALATFTAKNAAALQTHGIPTNDTNLYVMHNLGEAGGVKLLKADPNADARSIVGEAAARNNPLFYRGKPTVAVALARYGQQMGGAAVPAPTQTAAAEPEQPGFMDRVRSWYGRQQENMSQAAQGAGLPKEAADKFAGTSAAGNSAMVNNAPAIGSTLGAAAGSAVAPGPGTVGGGAVGGGAGQALKDFLQGRDQSPTDIAKEAALGGVLGVAPAGRPVVGALARVGGAAAVEGGAEAARGGDAGDVADKALEGATGAAGGEAFGRALGMVGHKVWSLFSPEARKSVQDAAGKYAEAAKTLETEEPKLPGAGGASSPNPKYEAAEKAKDAAEKTLKDAGLNPEEAAYAHKVSAEGVSTREAQVMKPAKMEEQNVGAGYQQLEKEVGAAGVGAPKAAPKLADGPVAAVENKQVSAKHAELAQRTEMAITAPAKSWQEKWVQLKDARSALLDAERDAMTSTATGRTKEAQDMRKLADTVRVQQEKVAKYVFGEKDGAAFMQRLKVLDVRYRNLMQATDGMKFENMATTMQKNTESSRALDRKFKAAFAGDPDALRAWDTLRKYRDPEATVPWTVAAEGLPVVGKVVKVGKLWGMLRDAIREQAAGNPARFKDILRSRPDAFSPAMEAGARNVMQRGQLQ